MNMHYSIIAGFYPTHLCNVLIDESADETGPDKDTRLKLYGVIPLPSVSHYFHRQLDNPA